MCITSLIPQKGNICCESLIKELVVKWGNKIKSATSGSNAENQINDILNELQRKIGDALKIDNYNVSNYIQETYYNYFNSVINMIVPELNSFLYKKIGCGDIFAIISICHLQLKQVML